LMVSLLIVKQLYNRSDESVVERWVENPYFQFFSGESVFQLNYPYYPTHASGLLPETNRRRRRGENP